MSEITNNKPKEVSKQQRQPSLERRALVGKLAKASVIVPVATVLFDASNNAANAE